jgi:hypothetical protein
LTSFPVSTFPNSTTPSTTPTRPIYAVAHGNNWAIRTIINKYCTEFEKRVKPTFVAVKVSVAAGARLGGNGRAWD